MNIAEFSKTHPLQCEWTFWFDKGYSHANQGKEEVIVKFFSSSALITTTTPRFSISSFRTFKSHFECGTVLEVRPLSQQSEFKREMPGISKLLTLIK